MRIWNERLLAALDDRALEPGASLDNEKGDQLRHVANTCARGCRDDQSAEVFAHRAPSEQQRDYRRIDSSDD